MKTVMQVLNNGEYEALYINDLIVEEGSPLNEGRERVSDYNNKDIVGRF